MTYSNLGWLSVVVLALLATPYVLNYVNRKLFKSKNKNIKKISKSIKGIHKPLGLAILIIGPIHGYMALGGFRLHTGTLLYLSIISTAGLGGSFYKTKKKVFFSWHKRMAIITVAMFLIHFFAPGAISYLLN